MRAVLYICVMVLGVLFGLGALWWWALFGMSVEGGYASVTTAVAVFFGGAVGLSLDDPC